MNHTLQLGDDGPEVRRLQHILSLRAEARHYPPVAVDGRLGPRTMAAYRDLGWSLGFTDETLTHGVTPTAMALLAEPSRRSEGQLDRARERAPRLAQRTIECDTAPCFWGLVKLLVLARRHGWSGTLTSADRRKGVAERYGHQSQAMLYACYQHKLATGSCSCSSCNPANRPGQSSHELCSDGSAFAGPVGRQLHWWELGLDCTETDQLISVARGLGYELRRPYDSPEEAHHVNFTSDPGPVVDVAHPADEDIVGEIPGFDPFAGLIPPQLLDDELPVEAVGDAPAAPDEPLVAAAERAVDDAAVEVYDEVPPPAAPLADDIAQIEDLGPIDFVPDVDDATLFTISGEPAVQGIDVAVYQGDIDWRKVRQAGHRFAFVRATYGSSDTDRNFGAGRLKAMAEAGIVRGYYHYAYPSGGDAVTEARHAVTTIKAAGGLVKGDLPLALDLEETRLGPAATYAWASDFCREVKRLTGAGCIVYTGPSFWSTGVGNPARPPDQGSVLWIAHYGVATPDVPRAWANRGWRFWQFTSSGSCLGIHGRVDQNHWHGTLAAFNALLLD